MAFKASDRRHHVVEFIRNPVTREWLFSLAGFYFYAIEFTRTECHESPFSLASAIVMRW